MKRTRFLQTLLFFVLIYGCSNNSKKTEQLIKAYDIDFNWGPGGPNGFTKPVLGSLMPPVDYYLSKPVDSLKGDERNIAVLARAFKNLPLEYVKQ